MICRICEKKIATVSLAYELARTNYFVNNSELDNWACHKCFTNPVRRERFYKKQAAIRRKEAKFKELLFGD